MNFILYEMLPLILNMSLLGSMIIVVVLCCRLFMKKAPKLFSYILWGIVLFRLLCPFAIQTDFSFVGIFNPPTTIAGLIEYIPQDIVHTENPRVQIPLPRVNDMINERLPQGEEQLAADPLEAPVSLATVSWLMGMAVMFIFATIQFLKLKKKLVGAIPLRDNIYLADHIFSPFVMGFMRPKIYLPSSMAVSEQNFIIAHEACHIKRFDHITRMLAFVALTIHWFNPLVWLAFILSGKDMEMSCDEAVMKRMDTDIRAEYSHSLLRFATGKNFIAATPLAFGEGDTKARVKNVMRYKKPMLWVSACTCIVVVIVWIGFAANPKADRHFTMTGNKLADLQPLEITQSIGELVGKDYWELALAPDNFGLTVSTDFSYTESEAIRFLYDIDEKKCKAAQLRIFPTEADFFVTEPNNNWVAPKEQVFRLYAYLEALKYLPQEEIAALCAVPPQRYSIELATNDRKYNEERQIFYDKDGIAENTGWQIRLDIQPLYGTGGGFNGVGNDIIHVYYHTSEKPFDDSIDKQTFSFSNLQPMQMEIYENNLTFSNDNSQFNFVVTWTPSGLPVEIGLLSQDGKEYLTKATGGSAEGVIKDISAGTYQVFLRNMESNLELKKTTDNLGVSGAVAFNN